MQLKKLLFFNGFLSDKVKVVNFLCFKNNFDENNLKIYYKIYLFGIFRFF